MFILGVVVGGLSVMIFNDFLGWKLSIMFLVVLLVVGYVFMVGVYGFWMLLFGRMLMGFVGGFIVVCILVYVFEIVFLGVCGVLGVIF